MKRVLSVFLVVTFPFFSAFAQSQDSLLSELKLSELMAQVNDVVYQDKMRKGTYRSADAKSSSKPSRVEPEELDYVSVEISPDMTPAFRASLHFQSMLLDELWLREVTYIDAANYDEIRLANVTLVDKNTSQEITLFQDIETEELVLPLEVDSVMYQFKGKEKLELSEKRRKLVY